jgi:hypothetical protein
MPATEDFARVRAALEVRLAAASRGIGRFSGPVIDLKTARPEVKCLSPALFPAKALPNFLYGRPWPIRECRVSRQCRLCTSVDWNRSNPGTGSDLKIASFPRFLQIVNGISSLVASDAQLSLDRSRQWDGDRRSAILKIRRGSRCSSTFQAHAAACSNSERITE